MMRPGPLPSAGGVVSSARPDLRSISRRPPAELVLALGDDDVAGQQGRVGALIEVDTVADGATVGRLTS